MYIKKSFMERAAERLLFAILGAVVVGGVNLGLRFVERRLTDRAKNRSESKRVPTKAELDRLYEVKSRVERKKTFWQGKDIPATEEDFELSLGQGNS